MIHIVVSLAVLLLLKLFQKCCFVPGTI